MASLSEQLKQGIPDFAQVDVTGKGATLFLPGKIVQQAKEAAEARAALGVGQRIRAPKGGALLKSQGTQRAVSMGKFYDDLGLAASSANAGNGMKKPADGLSFQALRALSDVWVDRLIIETRKMQARRFGQVCHVPGKQLGFRCVHKRYQDVDFKSDTPDIRARTTKYDKLLDNPTKPIHRSFGDFLENAIEEELVLDRRAIVLPQTKGGAIQGYHLTDGAYIMPRIEVLASWMIANRIDDMERAERDIQIKLLKNPPRGLDGRPKEIDFFDAVYVQVINEQIVDAWSEDELYLAIAHPTIRMNHWGYGRSLLEKSFGLSLLFVDAMRFNKNLFDVNYPEAILSVSGEYDEEGLSAFKRNVFEWDRAEASTRLPIVSGGITGEDMKVELLKLRETPKDMLMTELIRFVANLKCAAYGMHPSEINVTPDGQGGAVVQVDQSQGDEISAAEERGLHPLLTGLADDLSNCLIAEDDDDLMYIVEGLDQETEQSKIARIQAMSETSTFNEIRAAWDQKELPKGVPVDPGDYVMGSQYLAVIQSIQGQAQGQQQQDMGSYGNGDFGQGGGDPTDPNAPQGGNDAGGPGASGGPGAPPTPGAPPAPGQAPPAAPPPPGRPPQAAAPGGAPGAAGRKPNPLFKSQPQGRVLIDRHAAARWAERVGDE